MHSSFYLNGSRRVNTDVVSVIFLCPKLGAKRENSQTVLITTNELEPSDQDVLNVCM